MRIADVTIVVPARNEAGNIGPFLDSIPLASRSSSSTRATTPLHTSSADRGRTAPASFAHPAAALRARQLGAELASASWILFTDADVEFDPAYFERLARRPPADVVYGHLKLSRSDYARFYRAFAWGQRISDALGIPAATGSNMLVKRETLRVRRLRRGAELQRGLGARVAGATRSIPESGVDTREGDPATALPSGRTPRSVFAEAVQQPRIDAPRAAQCASCAVAGQGRMQTRRGRALSRQGVLDQ
jgi:hypothetical protein